MIGVARRFNYLEKPGGKKDVQISLQSIVIIKAVLLYLQTAFLKFNI